MEKIIEKIPRYDIMRKKCRALKKKGLINYGT